MTGGFAMRALVVFVAGILVGVAMPAMVAQAPQNQPAVQINHVALSVPNLEEAVKYYVGKLGFRDILRNPNGQSAYIQVSRDTFIELMQSNAERPVGINHWGLAVQDIKSTVATFRQRGLTVSDPGAPSAFTGGILANVTDAAHGRIELNEQPPDGKLRKASEGWRP
jgi:catechol 2,3-dioxygenase-like lactoylglutathione lyase family enzyme